MLVHGLTHWGRVTHICIGKLTVIGWDNGLLPGRCQAIIWTNAGILLIGTLGIYFSEILCKIYTFSFMKMHLNMSSAKWWVFCLCLDVLNYCWSLLIKEDPVDCDIYNNSSKLWPSIIRDTDTILAQNFGFIEPNMFQNVSNRLNNLNAIVYRIHRQGLSKH